VEGLIKHLVKPIVTVPYSMNIAGVAVTMNLNSSHCVLVEHYDGSLGIVTEKDIVRDVVALCKEPSSVRAWEVMKQPVIMVDENISIVEAIEIMKTHKIRNLIVKSGEEITGVVKRSKILNSLKLVEERKSQWMRRQPAIPQTT